VSSGTASPRRRDLVFTGPDERLLASAVGLSFDDELPGGALQTIDGGLGEERIGHDRQPLNRVPVRGEHRGRFVVALNDKLIQIGRLVTGVTVPAVTTFVRSSLPALITDAGERASAYALLAVLFQAAIATGPLLVAGTLLFAGPMTAILGAAGAVLVATAACLLAAGGLRTPRRAPRTRAGGRARLSAGLRTVVSVGACVGIATGLTSVAVPAAAIAHGHSVISGLAFGALAIGDLCGGMVVGGRLSRAWPVTARLEWSLLGAAIVSTLAAAATSRPSFLVPVLFLGGVVGAPVGITLSTLLDHVVDRRHLAGAYAMLVSAGLAAAAGGSALAGSAVGIAGPAGLLFCGGGVLVVADVWAIARRDTFVGDPDD
jgi:MFS family permease